MENQEYKFVGTLSSGPIKKEIRSIYMTCPYCQHVYNSLDKEPYAEIRPRAEFSSWFGWDIGIRAHLPEFCISSFENITRHANHIPFNYVIPDGLNRCNGCLVDWYYRQLMIKLMCSLKKIKEDIPAEPKYGSF
jgi:hypothetical protein